MERINIFNIFRVVINIMPYYGPTHKCFLLLSSLNSRIRELLSMYYELFRNYMLKYCNEVEIEDDNITSIFLPSDFFLFDITINSEKAIRIFIKFVENLALKQKYDQEFKVNLKQKHLQICPRIHYFRNHCLHDMINVLSLKLGHDVESHIKSIHEFASSIKVTEKLSFNKRYSYREGCVLTDKISLDYYDGDYSDSNEINPYSLIKRKYS